MKTKIIASEVKNSFRLSLPLILTFLAQGLSTFIGNVFIAKLGQDALDAGALVSIIYSVIIVFGFGLFSSTGVFVAEQHGAKNKKKIQNIVHQSFWFALIFSFISFWLMWFSPEILPLSHQSSTVISLATQYLHPLAFSILPLMIIFVYEQFFIGLGKTRILLWINLIQIPFEIIMMYALTFGKWGFPALSISGLGVSIDIVFYVGVFAVGLFIYFSKRYRDYHLFSNFQFHFKKIMELARIGSPVGLTYIIELVFFLILTFLMGHLGSTVLAAYQITAQFINFSMAIIFAIGQVVTARISYAIGKNDTSMLKEILFANLITGFIIMSVISACYMGIPEKIISIDINIHNPLFFNMIQITVSFFIIASIIQVADTFRFIIYGALRGAKDTFMPFLYNIIAFFLIALPLGYFFAFKLHFGGMGLWSGTLIGILFATALLFFRFNHFVKRLNTAHPRP